MDEKERLGREPIGKLMLQLALPTVIAQMVNLLYNIVDRIFVGRIPGEGTTALAGVGIAFPIMILITAFANLIGSGGSPRASIMMGKKNYEKAEEYLGNSVTLVVVFSVILMVFFHFTMEPILRAFGASDNTLPYAVEYLRIYLLGTIFVQGVLGLNPFITAQGFAKTSMATVLIGAALNIILDPIFIFVFDMGVRGAALATIISQAVSFVWVLRFLLGKKSQLKIRKSTLLPKKDVLISIFTLGVSPFIMTSTECLVQLTFNSGMAKYGNDLYISAMTLMFSIMQFVTLPMNGIGQGAQPILSYNYGAGNLPRVKEAVKKLYLLNLAVSVTGILIIELFPAFFIGLFTTDAELIAIGTRGLRIFIVGQAIFGAQCACQCSFMAFGEAGYAMFFALFRKIILLIPLALILPMIVGLGTMGLYLAEALADFISAATISVVFFRALPKLLARINQ